MGCSNLSKKGNIPESDHLLNNSTSSGDILSTGDNSFSDIKLDKEYQINIIIEIDESDKNKDIYFLNNIYNDTQLEQNTKIHSFPEINEFNTDLYINGRKYLFQKYFRPIENEKEYHIKLKFRFDFLIEDCSYMFYNCQNIKYIDLSKFNTLNVLNMKNMFYGCTNLKGIKLSLLFNTRNVISMEKMFTNCENFNRY